MVEPRAINVVARASDQKWHVILAVFAFATVVSRIGQQSQSSCSDRTLLSKTWDITGTRTYILLGHTNSASTKPPRSSALAAGASAIARMYHSHGLSVEKPLLTWCTGCALELGLLRQRAETPRASAKAGRRGSERLRIVRLARWAPSSELCAWHPSQTTAATLRYPTVYSATVGLLR
jgi:hypothetical protein